MEKISIREAIIVEGRYDKINLSQLIDGDIIEIGGFQIFKNIELKSLIKKLALARGIVILTDSDSAGFLIRNHLKGLIKEGTVKHAYIPDVLGKERRKRQASADRKLGVEGMNRKILKESLERAGVSTLDTEHGVSAQNYQLLTKSDLYELGLSGKSESTKLRKYLLQKLELPQLLSSSAMLDVLNALYKYDDALSVLRKHIFEYHRGYNSNKQDYEG